MNINEAATFLQMTRDQVKDIISIGLELPKSKSKCILNSTSVGKEISIAEQDLDEFITAFDKEDPGRHPPTAIRRLLLVEARHMCGICELRGPIEFHHIIEFSIAKHYDIQHMIAIAV